MVTVGLTCVILVNGKLSGAHGGAEQLLHIPVVVVIDVVVDVDDGVGAGGITIGQLVVA